MTHSDVETKLHDLTQALIEELIALTPDTMSEVQFEIVATKDDGADIGLLENHPDAAKVALSEAVYDCVSRYLPLIKQYVPGWKRSLLVLKQSDNGWNVSVNFDSA